MKSILVAAALLASPFTAHAETRLSASSDGALPPIAIAVNLPIRWDKSFGGSLYVGLSKHVALRANFATYDDLRLAGIFNGGYDGGTDGRTIDVGAGVVYYPRRLWDGLTLEAGVLRRAADITMTGTRGGDEIIDRRTTMYGVRALVGWSWLIKNHVFLSLAGGSALGYERGSEDWSWEFSDSTMTKSVSQSVTPLEGYIRVGGAF
jgi:hypothetical protein